MRSVVQSLTSVCSSHAMFSFYAFPLYSCRFSVVWAEFLGTVMSCFWR